MGVCKPHPVHVAAPDPAWSILLPRGGIFNFCCPVSGGKSRILLLSNLPPFPVLLSMGSAGSGGLPLAFVTPSVTCSDPLGAPVVTAPCWDSPEFTHVSRQLLPGCLSE